jgi:prepilin-type N-terminal cleavage/methylation domain-containing protein
MTSCRRRDAFTLVELLIAVVILGILATLVIPMFLDAGEDTRLATLTSDLAIVRQAMQIYQLQHPDGGTSGTSGTGGTGGGGHIEAAEAEEAPMEAMAEAEVELEGQVHSGGQGSFLLPYLNAIPINPFNNKKNIRRDGDPAGAGTHGWHIDSTTGRFSADDSPEHAEL